MRTAIWLLIGQLPLGLLAEPAPGGTATSFLQDHDARVREIVLAHPDTLPAADRNRVQALINEAFDFRELARLSLGDHWSERSDEERREFVRLFRAIIERRNFDLFVRYHREGRIAYTSEELDEAGRTVVRAEVPLRRETRQIAYFLHRPQTDAGKGAWRIYDLAVDGAGTAAANRRSYSRYIARHSYPELLDALRRQLDRLEGRG